MAIISIDKVLKPVTVAKVTSSDEYNFCFLMCCDLFTGDIWQICNFWGYWYSYSGKFYSCFSPTLHKTYKDTKLYGQHSLLYLNYFNIIVTSYMNHLFTPSKWKEYPTGFPWVVLIVLVFMCTHESFCKYVDLLIMLT